METLSIKELAPYLPYRLNIQVRGEYSDKENNTLKTFELISAGPYIEYHEIGRTVNEEAYYEDVLPLLMPLSYLTKGHVDYIYFVIIGTDNDMYGGRNEFEDTLFELLGDPIHLPVLVYNYLLEKHFDLFNLIKKGLAIDLNTIKETVK